MGFAFDGDGDRLISVDHTGEIRDGDYALAIAGRHWPRGAAQGQRAWSRPSWPTSASTRRCAAAGIEVVKTQVGDRYVLRGDAAARRQPRRRAVRPPLFLDHAPTGDGILSALRCCRVMRETGEPLAVARLVHAEVPAGARQRPRPQQAAVRRAARLSERVRGLRARDERRGRILIRYSGTESLARVMIEGADGDRIRAMADELAGVIRGLIGAAWVSGIGVDVVQLPRMREVIARWDERFLQRVFTEREIAYSNTYS